MALDKAFGIRQGWPVGSGQFVASGTPTPTPTPMPAPVNTAAPAITGTSQVGQMLTSTQGTWTNSPTSYTHQWRWADTNAPISGATNATYTPVTGDIGHTLANTVTATNAGGSTSQSSAATAAVIAAATGLPAFTSFVVMGDSFTDGSNASSTANRYSTLIATNMGATELNRGIGGTVLQNTNASGGSPMGNNMRDRFIAQMTGASKQQFAMIAGGFNDARYTGAPATFNVTEYANDLGEMLNGLIANGYARNEIAVISPWWINDTGLTVGSAGFTGQTRSGFEAFVAAAAAKALEYGTYYHDAYAWMVSQGYAPDTDNLHPTDAGHAIIANGILTQSAITNTAAAVAGAGASSTVGNQLDATWTAYSGAVSYEVQVALNGALTYDQGSATPSTNSASITGLTAGSQYIYRVRAVLSGGAKTPWAFYLTPTIIAAPLDAVTTAYLAAMTVQPDNTRKTLINNLIAGLRSDGLLAKMTGTGLGFGLFAAHDEQASRLNVTNPGTGTGQLVTVIGGETFTTDRGWQGNGTTGQMDTGLTFAGYQDTAAMGLWNLTDGVLTPVDMGNTNSLMACKSAASGTSAMRLNAASGGGLTVPTDARGFLAVTRTSSTAHTSCRNGSTTSLATSTSTTPDATNTIRVGGRSGTTAFSARQFAFWFMGANMSGADLTALYNRVRTYMTGVGVP